MTDPFSTTDLRALAPLPDNGSSESLPRFARTLVNASLPYARGMLWHAGQARLEDLRIASAWLTAHKTSQLTKLRLINQKIRILEGNL